MPNLSRLASLASFLLLSVVSMSLSVFGQEKAYDYVIKNALIFDGKSPRGFIGDVAVNGDTIVGVGKLDEADARQMIDATGLVLAPGFIDTHTHSDFNSLIYPSLPNKLVQGVTTEIIGNCGMSAAPVEGAHEGQIHAVWAREGVEIPEKIPWNTFREYQSTLEEMGLNTNLAALVGHGNLRTAVMGLAPRAATPDEIKAMKKILVQALNEGAYGISFGLVYLPGVFAQEEELVELCREVAERDGICAFHMRSEGSMLIEAVGEAIRIGEKSGARVQISHLKAAGKDNWGKIQEAFQLIEEARKRDLKIEADAYPYTASFAELGVILPDFYFQREDRIALFEDLTKRQDLLKELENYYQKKNMNWESVIIATTSHPNYQSYRGKSIQALAKEQDKNPVQVLVEILAGTSFRVSAFYFSQSQEVVDQVLAKPYVTIGSDSIGDGSRGPHPRAFGTFPKFIRESVREKKQLELGEAIRKITSVPAKHFGLKNRGQVAPGYIADLVLFDSEQFRDLANYEVPGVLSEGVVWVFVNGEAVIKNGQWTYKKSGQFLLRNG